MEDLLKLEKQFGNDMEFGLNVRPFVRSTEEYGSLEKENPNDLDLGKKLRKILLELV